MELPLVTVVCLCYNHKKFLRKSIESVLNQTYSNIQIIVVDDASHDGSADEITNIKSKHSQIEILLLKQNVGNCRAFNQGLKLAKGDFLIDLATDDILLPNRVEVGVREILNAGEKYGVHFSDAEYINEHDTILERHSKRFPHNTVPIGDVYKDLIQRYFICPPTVMMRMEVMQKLGGYDENLSYEDFDFWIRSSREFYYCYSEELLVQRRIVRNSMSSQQRKVLNKHASSTFKVCKKIVSLNKSRKEKAALSKRILYEIRENLRFFNLNLVFQYMRLWIKNSSMHYPE